MTMTTKGLFIAAMTLAAIAIAVLLIVAAERGAV